MSEGHTARPAAAKTWQAEITEQGVARQLVAMGCESYDLRAIDEDSASIRKDLRDLSPDEVQSRVPTLRALNTQGCHIYIGPHESDGLLLLDDVTPDMLRDLHIAGFTPALLLKTSWEQFQARVRVSTSPIPKDLATAVTKELARRFGADKSAANWRQLGRLAGFTNRKRKYRKPNGHYPYVTVLRDGGQVAPEGGTLLREVAASLAITTADATRPEDFLRPQAAPCDVPEWEKLTLAQEYRRYSTEHAATFTINDWSTLDFMMTQRLARAHPEATVRDLARAIMAGSLNPKVQRGRHDWQWCLRTAENALTEVDRTRLRR